VPLRKPPMQATSTSKGILPKGRPPKWKKIPVNQYNEMKEMQQKSTMQHSEPSSKPKYVESTSSTRTYSPEPTGSALTTPESSPERQPTKLLTAGARQKTRSHASGGASKSASALQEARGRVHIEDLEKIISIINGVNGSSSRKGAPKYTPPVYNDPYESDVYDYYDYVPPSKREKHAPVAPVAPLPVARTFTPQVSKKPVDKYGYAFKSI